ncbi:hypothetical protein SLS53_003792 [Cytospora paraplurivora]|uniref:HNH nuclease domain-containing protein n=1 Tax=Cytospora paraplurivora TaxID=2898453 RepID=A0AAN9UA32_9PEZI
MSSSASPPAMGVHHRTALLACQIVANNAFDGYLATDRHGKHRVRGEPDELLYSDKYWFIAKANDTDGEDGDDGDADSRNYPVVPSFQDWQFPHDPFARLRWKSHAEPPPDQTPATDAASRTVTVPSMPPPPRPSMCRCAISKMAYSVHAAHLIPVAQDHWFQKNGMAIYGAGDASDDINSMNNILHMQNSLHSVWDRHVFAIVPKRSEFVVHLLAVPDDATCEFAAQWHNTPVQPTALGDKPNEYLFAKFAQAVFMLTKRFIVRSGAIQRRVARFKEVRNAEGKIDGYKTVTEKMDGHELEEQYGGGGSRSASASRKRSLSRATGDAEEATWYERNVRARLNWTVDDEDADWYDRAVRPTLLQEEEVDLWPDEKPRVAHGSESLPGYSGAAGTIPSIRCRL